jgi:hypothetical protein
MLEIEIIKDIFFKIITNGIEEIKELAVSISNFYTESLQFFLQNHYSCW